MRTVAVLTGLEYAFMRGALKGIAAFFADKPDWQLDVTAANLPAIERLPEIEPAGVIILMPPPEWLERPELRGRPVCTLFQSDPIGPVANVTNDNVAFGRLAGEHLKECGFENFGFVGPPHYYEPTYQRFEGMCEALGRTQEEVFVFQGVEQDAHASSHWRGPKWPAKMADWLAKQPRPLGILATTDVYALGVCRICHDQGLRVPEDVAVIGTGNDDVLCQLSQPLLSSVAFSWESLGYEAARQLTHRMDGEDNEPRQIVIPPIGVVPRGSTDVSATMDEIVLQAGRYMRDHCGNFSLNVGQIAHHVGVSQRTLERRFRRAIGRSMLEEIRRVRVNRVKQMLAETELPIDMIAKRAGLRSTTHMATIFRKIAGQTPTQFRKQFRPPLPG